MFFYEYPSLCYHLNGVFYYRFTYKFHFYLLTIL